MLAGAVRPNHDRRLNGRRAVEKKWRTPPVSAARPNHEVEKNVPLKSIWLEAIAKQHERINF